MKISTFIKSAALAALLGSGVLVAGTGVASASFVGPVPDSGNDCSGSLGTIDDDPDANGFYGGTCAVDGSPFIVKFEFEGTSIAERFINALFPSIDGFEFAFDFGTGGTGMGTWTYTPAAGDPLITAFSVKGGPNFNLYTGSGTSSAFVTPLTGGGPSGGSPAGLSHIIFYDTQVPPPPIIPLPAAGWLLVAGLGGLAALRRRKV